MSVDSAPWQPTTFRRFIKGLRTSSSTVEVLTDQGNGFLKALGNPSGPHALAKELVGTKLARRFGLRTFEFALLRITEDDEIPLARGGLAMTGPAFIARKEEQMPWGGSAEELVDLQNLGDISRLVVFDTWTLNCDRHPADLTVRRPNYDNVFLSVEGDAQEIIVLKAMDHTHCFTCGGDLNHKIATIERIQDRRVYGNFPGFLTYLRREEVRQALDDLGSIQKHEIEEIVRSVPAEWEVDEPTREALVGLIRRRAIFIRDNSEGILEDILAG